MALVDIFWVCISKIILKRILHSNWKRCEIILSERSLQKFKKKEKRKNKERCCIILKLLTFVKMCHILFFIHMYCMHFRFRILLAHSFDEINCWITWRDELKNRNRGVVEEYDAIDWQRKPKTTKRERQNCWNSSNDP